MKEHLHSEISFISPNYRYLGCDVAILKKRQMVYEKAKEKKPNRWSGKTRRWSSPRKVVLNGNNQQTIDVLA